MTGLRFYDLGADVRMLRVGAGWMVWRWINDGAAIQVLADGDGHKGLLWIARERDYCNDCAWPHQCAREESCERRARGEVRGRYFNRAKRLSPHAVEAGSVGCANMNHAQGCVPAAAEAVSCVL